MNPAARLLSIYDTLIRQQKDQTMTNTWAVVFDLEINTPHLEDDVTSCLVAVRQQIDFTRMRLTGHGVPPELTSPGFDRLKSVASPGLLHSSWNGHRGNIQPPECRQGFAWAAWVLSDEDEGDMPAADLAALREEIASLEQTLQNTEMSPYLRDFIQRQLDTIRAALRIYGIQGTRPVKDALQKVAGAYTVERTRVEAEHQTAPEAAQSVLAKASDVIKKTAEVCDNLEKVTKFGEGAWSLAKSVGPLVLPYLGKLGA